MKKEFNMNEGKPNLYLSELFLETLNGDFSLEALLKALKNCDEEVILRSKKHGHGNMKISRLLRKFGFKHKVPQYVQQEFLDFWDVYKEFDDMLPAGIKKEYYILQL